MDAIRYASTQPGYIIRIPSSHSSTASIAHQKAHRHHSEAVGSSSLICWFESSCYQRVRRRIRRTRRFIPMIPTKVAIELTITHGPQSGIPNSVWNRKKIGKQPVSGAVCGSGSVLSFPLPPVLSVPLSFVFPLSLELSFPFVLPLSLSLPFDDG